MPTKSKFVRRFARTPKQAISESVNSAILAPKPETKISKVVELLMRDEGATLDDMVDVTGWQAHTTRAALTGLRKKGHSISKSKTDGATRYAILAEVRR